MLCVYALYKSTIDWLINWLINWLIDWLISSSGSTCECDGDCVCLFAAAPTWFIIVLSLSIALASLIIVAAVVILACLRFCPACRRPSCNEQPQQQQQSLSRRSSLRIDMPPPYPGPFIPGQVIDLMSHEEPTVWTTHTDNVNSTNEACGGVDVLDKKWPLDDDYEGYFVPDAVEMNAKLEEAIPPPPHVHYDQHRHHHHHDRYRHHRQQQQHGEDNDSFVPDDVIPHRLTAPRSQGTSSFSSGTPVSAAWRRQTSAETGASDSTTWASLSSSTIGSGSGSGIGGGGGGGSGFSGSSSSRLRSPAWFLVPSTASSSVSSQSPLVLDDDPDTTQTSVDYY